MRVLYHGVNFKWKTVYRLSGDKANAVSFIRDNFAFLDRPL